MELLIILLAWSIVVILIFIFVPNSKIRAIGGFFSQVLPKLPISEILKLFKK